MALISRRPALAGACLALALPVSVHARIRPDGPAPPPAEVLPADRRPEIRVPEEAFGYPLIEDVAPRVARGARDLRAVRAYWRLYLRHWPFSSPPVDVYERAWRAWGELVARTAAAERKSDVPALGDWTSIGPCNVPGRMTDLVVRHNSSGNTETVWAAAAGGGVWRTAKVALTDPTASKWEPLSDAAATLAVGALAVTTNRRTIYAGTGEGNYASDNRWGEGVLRSADSGDTWSLERTDRREFHQLVVETKHAERLWAATTTGLYRSTDSGAHWAHPASLPEEDTTSVVVFETNPLVVLAGIGSGVSPSENSGVWRSTDGGTNWERIASFPQGGYVGRVSLARSQNSKVVWAAASIAGEDSFGQLLWIGRSTNRGQTFSEIAPPVDEAGDVEDVCLGICYYTLALAVDASDSKRAYLGGFHIWSATSAGVWKRISEEFEPQEVHPDVHRLVSTKKALWAATDGGIYVTPDGGGTWSPVGQGLVTSQFYHLSSRLDTVPFAIGGTQDQGVLRQVKGCSWEHLTYDDGGFTAIDWTKPTIYYASSLVSGQVLTYEGLQAAAPSATLAPPPDVDWPSVFPFILDRSTPQRILYGADEVHCMGCPTNGNAAVQSTTLQPLSSLLPSVVSAMDNCRDVPDALWLGMDDGNVRRRTIAADGTVAWPTCGAIPAVHSITAMFAIPDNPDVAYLTRGGFDKGQVGKFVGCNAAATGANAAWHDLTTADLPSIPFNDVIVVPAQPNAAGSLRYVIAAADVGLYFSIDDGKSWWAGGNGLPNAPVSWLSFSPATRLLRAATHGRGVWELKLP